VSRVAVCEPAIDALGMAAIEQQRYDTLYVATAGGMGPATIAALRQLLEERAASEDGDAADAPQAMPAAA
jgi:hypothetical protein